MPKSTNKLLTTLSALGLIAGASSAALLAGITTAQAEDTAFTGEIESDLRGKLGFIQAYPQSAVAQKLLAQIVSMLAAMDPIARAAALEAVNTLGGVPSSVPGIEQTPFGALDVAEAFGTMTTASASVPGTVSTTTASIY